VDALILYQRQATAALSVVSIANLTPDQDEVVRAVKRVLIAGHPASLLAAGWARDRERAAARWGTEPAGRQRSLPRVVCSITGGCVLGQSRLVGDTKG
jgi:hypothetical protein